MKQSFLLAFFFGCHLQVLASTSASGQTKSSSFRSHLADAESTALHLERGQLISAKLVKTMTKKDLLSIPNLARALSNRQLEPKNGVLVYSITYQTKSPKAPIVASGVILVPDPMPFEAAVISLQHGTLPDKASAPSKSPYEGLFEASLGFVTLVQDYLGYGVSENILHPYIIAESYADTGVDFLKASYKFANLNKLRIGKLFLKGYSEGGYATLALQRELELNYPGEFPIEASAPSAGPYNLKLVSELLLAKEKVQPFLIPYLLLSYSEWLPDENLELEEIFQVRAKKIKYLFNGKFSGRFIYMSLPKKTSQLFDTGFASDFLLQDSTLPSSIALKKLLEEQSFQAGTWSPQSRTKFYHCRDDEVIPIATLTEILKEFEDNKNVAEPVIYTTKPDETPFSHITCPGIYDPTLEFISILNN